MNQFTFNKSAKEYKPKDNKDSQVEINRLPSNVALLNGQPLNEFSNIKFNLNAKEFSPKKTKKDGFEIGGLDDSEDEKEDSISIKNLDSKLQNNEDIKNEENDIDIDDLIENGIEDIGEDDEEEWIPKFKNCPCCKGYIYKCKETVCQSMGVCYCKAQEEFDPDMK